MGNFGGHALPGSFFILFSIYWTVQIYRRMLRKPVARHCNGHDKATRDNQRKGVGSKNMDIEEYRNSVTFPIDCCASRCLSNFPWEGFFKVFFTTVGLTLEILTAFKDGKFTYLGNAQHATMFSAFALSGVIDILLHYGVPLPEKSDYAVSILAFAVEDILFMFHLHGRSPLDMMLHQMLVFVIHGCVLAILLEMRLCKYPGVALLRAYFVLLQGTWFWQLGFILYNPIPGHQPWNGENHDLMMIGAVIFAWHVILDFVVILSIGLIVRCFYSKRYSFNETATTSKYEEIRLLSRDDQLVDYDSEVNSPVVIVG